MLADLYCRHYNIQTDGEVDRTRVVVKAACLRSLHLLCTALRPHLCHEEGRLSVGKEGWWKCYYCSVIRLF